MRFQHGDAAAQPQIGLGQLQPDRAAADDDQMVELVAVVEDRLVGEVGHAVEARDGRDRRRGAGGDDEAPRLDALVAGQHRVAADELGRGLDHR